MKGVWKPAKFLGLGFLTSQSLARSDSTVAQESVQENVAIPSLIQQADEAVESSKPRIKTPLQFEQIKQTLQGNGAQTFDGFRCAVQKQINLNTVVSHFYWIGSQAIGQPIYQYRLILHEDDKMINVATDMDFNVEGEIKLSVTPRMSLKSNFTLAEQSKSANVHLDYSDESFTGQLEYVLSGSPMVGLSYMQSVTPNLALGGNGKFYLQKGIFGSAYGGVYDTGDNMLMLQWDNQMQLLYVKRVNRNRVHLSSQLTVDENMKAQGAVSAEFILKQSKLNFSVDSDLMVKSAMETGLSAGMQMQLAAEIHHISNHYRFGYGIMIGGS